MVIHFLKRKFWDLKYKNCTDVEWQYLSYKQNIQIDFATHFQDKLDWKQASVAKQNENFIRTFKDKVCWYEISLFQDLSEEFMIEFQNKLSWNEISYNNLSESFIEKFADKLNWVLLFNKSLVYKNLSKQFVKKHNDKISYDCYEPILFFKKETSWRRFL
jgi:hypothetical protein